MRKYLRNIAKVKMQKMGVTKVNKRMSATMNHSWRKVIGAYPTHILTKKKMDDRYRGRQNHKPGATSHLYSYSMAPVKG